ncbi:MAG TPA: hypothetical protein VGJ14_16015 [Sporichthyaceae bacterium]|jgi:hypothetical protein
MNKRTGFAAAAAMALAAVTLVPAAAGASASGVGGMVVCNHGGYGFDVFADGPDSFTDDLAGSFNECADWAPAHAGQYEVGFSFPYAAPPGTIFNIRIKRAGHTTYRNFNSEGTFNTNVGRGQITRIDFYIH